MLYSADIPNPLVTAFVRIDAFYLFNTRKIIDSPFFTCQCDLFLELDFGKYSLTAIIFGICVRVQTG